MVAEKDFHAPKHPELETIPNLQVVLFLAYVIVCILVMITMELPFDSHETKPLLPSF